MWNSSKSTAVVITSRLIILRCLLMWFRRFSNATPEPPPFLAGRLPRRRNVVRQATFFRGWCVRDQLAQAAGLSCGDRGRLRSTTGGDAIDHDDPCVDQAVKFGGKSDIG